MTFNAGSGWKLSDGITLAPPWKTMQREPQTSPKQWYRGTGMHTRWGCKGTVRDRVRK